MLHLQTRVHLHEEEVHVHLACSLVVALFHNELNCARAYVVHCSGSSYRRFTHLFTQCFRQTGRRRLFQYLLMTTLHRAIALHEVNAISLRIAKHLNFNVTWALYIFFYQHRLIAKTVLRFALA